MRRKPTLKLIALIAATASIGACTTTPPAQGAQLSCPMPQLNAAQLSQLRFYINDALNGEDQHERNNGLRGLESVPAPEGLAVLKRAAREDADMSNQMLALNILTRLALQGYEVIAIRDTFRQIAADPGSNVQSQARDSYNEVLKVAPLD
jgi:hypothetical protein